MKSNKSTKATKEWIKSRKPIMKKVRTPKAGEKFYSARLDAEGYFPEWATKEYIAEQRKKYESIYIPAR